ncbi:MAG: cytochrome c family protein, partial [Pseudomonadota bacterium]
MSRIIYHPTMPEEPSYIIEVASEDGIAADQVAEEVVPLPVLLASADLGGGESGAKKCVACHSFEEGGADKIGPNLYAIVGRDIGASSGFAYSDALGGMGGVWDYEALDGFLANPKGWAPGTKMAYAGMRSAEDRADLILYLRSLAADPLPLPEAEAVETEAAEETEGGASESETADAAEASEGAAEEAEGMADAALEQAEEVAEEAGDAAEEVAEAAADVVEDAQETAETAAEAVADAASETAEAAGDAVADASEAAEDAVEGVAEEAADAAAAVSDAAGAAASGLVALVAAGDVDKGEKVSKKCKACHVFEEGGKNKLGPALWGIVGKDIASHDGYKYSSALMELEGDWTYDALDQFLAAPKKYVPGTKMVFAGVRKEQDRADLL